ncbi:hypothetical protein K440DRAFT_618858 [Wilcoxina mikolae CBS 423.85]|nr:hypothetical protein K440DRAFT_618858 [Wilcoxina mikolae CBS 423.85]
MRLLVVVLVLVVVVRVVLTLVGVGAGVVDFDNLGRWVGRRGTNSPIGSCWGGGAERAVLRVVLRGGGGVIVQAVLRLATCVALDPGFACAESVDVEVDDWVCAEPVAAGVEVCVPEYEEGEGFVGVEYGGRV